MILLLLLLLVIVVSGLLLLISPIPIGFLVIAFGNEICKTKRGIPAPLWWKILTWIVSIGAIAMFWYDAVKDVVDFGPLPLGICVFYGILSLVLLYIREG